MLALRARACSSRLGPLSVGLRGLRSSCAPAPPTTPLRSWADGCAAHRQYATRFQKSRKKKLELLEREGEEKAAQQSWWQQGTQGQQTQQMTPYSSAAPPSDRQSEREAQRAAQTGSQYEYLGSGVVDHMRKVYGTLATGIGIAAGASIVTMATPLVGISPIVPGHSLTFDERSRTKRPSSEALFTRE